MCRTVNPLGKCKSKSRHPNLDSNRKPITKIGSVAVCHWNSGLRNVGCSPKLFAFESHDRGSSKLENLLSNRKGTGSIPSSGVDFRLSIAQKDFTCYKSCRVGDYCYDNLICIKRQFSSAQLAPLP